MDSAGGAVLLLVVCNLVIPGFIIATSCVSRRGVEFNHILLFSVGFIVYWILPMAVGLGRPFESASSLKVWYEIFDAIPVPVLVTYLLISLGAYLCFYFGSLVGAKMFPGDGFRWDGLFFDARLLNVYLIAGVVVAAAFSVALRDELFKGYTGTIYEEFGLRGSFTAATLLLLSLAFLYACKLEQKYGRSIGLSKVTLNRFCLAYFIGAALVASMGGRLYFISSIVMLAVYRSVYFERIGMGASALLVLVLGVVTGALGVIRQGVNITANDVVFNLMAEPVFTSFSLIAFLREGSFEVINWPRFLMSGFVNIIPTIIYPSKGAIILSPEDYGYTVDSPGGALNSFVSFIVNFGIMGTLAALFLLSVFLSVLKGKGKGKGVLFKTMYVMISGWLPITFFRDAFSISIVKAIFQFSILMPFLVVVSLHFVSLAVRGTLRGGRLRRGWEPLGNDAQLRIRDRY